MWNYRIATVWGIPIRINVSLVVFIPVLAYLIGSGQQIAVYAGIIDGFARQPVDVDALGRGTMPWVVGFVAAIGLFVSVLLHELGHAWAAMRYDIEIESITLWILGGMAALSRLPKEWNREFWIAVAGPFVSLLVGIGCYVVVVAVPIAHPVVLFVLGWLAITNIVLLVFNLVPAFPMDGGRVLRALLARNRPHAQATRIAARVGVYFAILFAVAGVFTNPMLVLLALFIYGAAKTESRITVMADLLEGFTAGELTDSDLPRIEADATLEEFGQRMLGDRKTTYLVTEHGTIVGAVTLDDFRGAKGSDRSSMTVGDIAGREAARVVEATPAFDALTLFGRTGPGYVFVERDGETIGIMSEQSIGHVLALQQSGLGARREVGPF